VAVVAKGGREGRGREGERKDVHIPHKTRRRKGKVTNDAKLSNPIKLSFCIAFLAPSPSLPSLL